MNQYSILLPSNFGMIQIGHMAHENTGHFVVNFKINNSNSIMRMVFSDKTSASYHIRNFFPNSLLVKEE